MIRAAVLGDADAIAAVYAPYVLDSYATFEEDPPRAPAIEARMLTEPRLPWLIAEQDGSVVGYAYASLHRARAGYRWDVDVAVYLAPNVQGQGLGRELYDALLPVIRDLGYLRAFAGIALPNEASVRLHEACGFTLVATFPDVGYVLGTWRDVGWWQLYLQQPQGKLPAVPAEPRPWDGTIT